jgi:hypothetical protein
MSKIYQYNILHSKLAKNQKKLKYPYTVLYKNFIIIPLIEKSGYFSLAHAMPYLNNNEIKIFDSKLKKFRREEFKNKKVAFVFSSKLKLEKK